jgi:hypothetical protein
MPFVIWRWMMANPNGKVESLREFLQEYHLKVSFDQEEEDEGEESKADN